MVIAYIKKADPKASFSNRQNHKPSSVLSRHLSTQPTPWNEAGSLFTLAGFPVYMVLLALVPPPSYVAIWRRELLPRGFTLTLREGGLFSVAAFLRLLPPVLSTAGCPSQSGLSSLSNFWWWFLRHCSLFISSQPKGCSGIHCSHSLKSLIRNLKERQVVLPIYTSKYI